MLYQDFDDFKKYIGGSFNYSVELESIQPSITLAAERHLEPFFGDQFIQDELTGTPSVSAEVTELFKRAVAHLTVYEYSKIGAIQFTESGIHRMDNDNLKTAYKYQVQELQETMLYAGYDIAERLQITLDKIDPIPANYLPFQLNWIRYAKDMRRYYSSQIPRYTFESMRNTAEEVEIWLSDSVACPDFYAEMLSERFTTTDSNKIELFDLFKRAVAHFTVRFSIQKNIVQIKGSKVLVSNHTGDDAMTQTQNVSIQDAASKILHSDQFGRNWLARFERLLAKNRNEIGFETYDACLTAQEEAQALEEQEDCERIAKKSRKKKGNSIINL